MKLLNLIGFGKTEEKLKVLVVEDTTTRTAELVNSLHKNYPKEVLEIHHEFHTAADKLVLEAKTIILEAASKNVSKVARLELLGFKQAAQVTELKPLQQQAELSKEQLESLAYFQREYPLHKFITEEQVKIICHKYNLVCGDVSRFKGFVPEKNLNEIANFKLKDKEANLNCKYEYASTFYTEDELKSERKWLPDHEYMKETKSDCGTRRIQLKTLQICAPIKDMDISGLELKEGYKLEKKHIPDPIVLQPVKNGYLILTAWGDEASDPLVANQKFN